MQQRLRALHDLGVGRLGLGDRLIVLGARGHLAREVVVDAREPLRQDAQVVLDLGCESSNADARTQGSVRAPSSVCQDKNRQKELWRRAHAPFSSSSAAIDLLSSSRFSRSCQDVKRNRVVGVSAQTIQRIKKELIRYRRERGPRPCVNKATAAARERARSEARTSSMHPTSSEL